MKILHVFNSMNCGGAEKMIMNILRCIDRNEFQFDFLVHSDTPAFFDAEIKKLGGNIYKLPRWNILNTIKYKKALDDFFKSHSDYSLVHGHMESSAALYLKAAKKYGIKTVVHSHNPYPPKISLKTLLFKLLNLKTRKYADFFLACSMDAGIERFGGKCVKSDIFKVLPNSVDTSKYPYSEEAEKEIKEKYSLDNKFVVGHMGRFDGVKNHLFLLNVFYEIQKQNKDSVLLLLGDGKLQNKIKKTAKKLGIFDKIIFTGVLSNAHEYLQAMDAFVFPSFYEGLGMAVIEAECVGIPCFITDTLPKDLDINDNVYRISLDKSYKEWASLILNNHHNKTDNKTALLNIKNAGYDISETIKKTEEFYKNFDKICKKKKQ